MAENPGLGTSGQYYYYQTMTKALSAANLDTLKLANGNEADWPRMFPTSSSPSSRATAPGKTPTANGWESNPVLVTAYSILALEQVYYSIPNR